VIYKAIRLLLRIVDDSVSAAYPDTNDRMAGMCCLIPQV